MSSANQGGETTRLGLSGGGKSYGRSYGSTQRSVKETFLPHNVVSTDTLQGIALKYGVTVQELKRVNKLYTNDSIFLRSVLYIPVGEQPLPASVLENTVSSVQGSPLKKASSGAASNGDREENHIDVNTEDKTKSDPLDFLSKIDQEIKLRKDELKKVEKGSRLGEVEDNLSKFSSPHKSHQDGSQHVSPTPGDNESYQLGTSAVVDIHTPQEGPENKYREQQRGGSTSPILGAIHSNQETCV